MVVSILATVGLLGVLTLALGVRGRRIDDHPWCRKCRYDLSGLDSPTTCTECGADLAKKRAVRIGQRRKRPVLLSLGALMLAAALTGGGIVSYQTDWTRVKPLWLLKHESVRSDPAKRNTAVREMIRRLYRSEVSESQRQGVIALALAQQADPNEPWNHLWGELMREEWAADRLSVEQKEAFLRGAFIEGITPQTKKVVRAGGELPIRIIAPPFRVSNTAAPGPTFSAFIAIERITIGELEDNRKWFPMRYAMFPQTAQLSAGSHASARLDAPPGEHDVSVRCRIGVIENDEHPWTGSTPHVNWDEALVTWRETLTLRVRVVDADEPIIERVKDESLAEAIRQSLRIEALPMSRLPGGRVLPRGMIQIASPPTDIGFTIHLRPRDGGMAGVEMETGEAAAAAGQSRSLYIGRGADQLPLGTAAVDIILRTSVTAAERDLDVTGPIWDGEIVIEDIPVRWDNGS